MSRSPSAFTGTSLSGLSLAGANGRNLRRLLEKAASVHSHHRGDAL
ncbi:hypothetical protein [Nitrosomonas sp.]|nr:hypothetical protein [Nitrosomonas sp.]